MKQALKAMVALGIALLILFAVRAYAFTIYTVPSDISMTLKRGDRVIVNRLCLPNIRRGDHLVFAAGGDLLARVVGLPGDTILLSGRRYAIPLRCCDKCECPDCRLYLVNLGGQRTLIYKHQVVGKAYRIYHLPW